MTDPSLFPPEITNAAPTPDGIPKPVYFLCQRGNDSQIAARRFCLAEDEEEEEERRERRGGGDEDMSKNGKAKRKGKRWIGDVIGGLDALQRLPPPVGRR